MKGEKPDNAAQTDAHKELQVLMLVFSIHECFHNIF